MKISATLSRYLARNYLVNVSLMLLVLLSIIYLFDTVELLRRAGKQGDTPLILVLKMGLLKLPEVGQLLVPFAILFSGMLTFWQLTRRYELVVARSAGFSVWQFLAPVIGVGIAIGFLNLFVINPIGAMFLSKFEALENDHLSHKRNYVTLLREGLWLRQMQQDEDDYVILHSGRIDLEKWQLKDVMVMFFNGDDEFKRRIDSKTARLDDGQWLFEEAISHEPDSESQSMPLVALPTDLTTHEIEESFASPETMPFWNLPGFIRTMEATGFDATPMKIHFHSLLAQPLLFAAMILIAAAVSMRPPRMGGTFPLIVIGVSVGFLVFFMSSFLQALGASHQIPVILAAWTPAVITLLLGIAAMLNLEDG